jgi:histidyl-tRNA synthetase
MIPDAEVMKVLIEILTKLDIGGFVVKLNHRKFLDAMVDISGCEKRKFKAICSSIDKLDKEPWEKVKDELITMKGLTEEMTTKLHKFVQYIGKPLELLERLKAEEVFKGHKEGEETIKEMDTLFSYLKAFNCLDRISFDFSLARGLDYYTGLIYEAVLTDTNRVGSIAGGGRYDTLVGMFSNKPVPSVGVSVGIERIFSILEEKCKEDFSIRPTETQILIAQLGKNLIEERMKIMNDLWALGIKCETLYQENPKPNRQMEMALESGIPLVLFIGESEVAEGKVKIKSLNKHEEYILTREELAEGSRLR